MRPWLTAAFCTAWRSKASRYSVVPLRCLLIVTVVLGSVAVGAAMPKNAVERQAVAELLALHQQDRQAHFKHDINALLVHTAPEVLDVRNGRTRLLTRKDLRAKFAGYFSHTEFSAWDDVEPPVVRVSPDGRMGWMVVRVHLVYIDHDKSGKASEERSTMAWMSAYEKRDGVWLMTAVTSTSDER
jgi:hypothetical protein